MNLRHSIAAAPLLAAVMCVHANEGIDLSKTRAIAASSVQAAPAPFAARGRDPLPELLMRDEQERRGPSGSCQHSAYDLCYDLSDRRVIYRPAREYMPRIQGLTPESVSVRHDRLTLRYSFK